MSEEKTISRLSAFIFGAMVFIIGIYHTFPNNVYWLSFVVSASSSFLSGLFLRKNTTPFKLKSLLYMSSMLVMFPVFNYYVRETLFKFCFVFPLVIYLMFLAGHSLKFKTKFVKSLIITVLSVVFIAGSYFYIPFLMFHLNEKQTKQKIDKIELLKLNGEKLSETDIKGKTVLFYFQGNILKLDEIAKAFKDNKEVLIFYIFEESEIYHNLKTIKELNFEEKYSFKVLFDKDNLFSKSLNFDKIPGAFFVDKNLKIKRLYMNEYFFYGNYYSKKIIEQISDMVSE